PARTLLTAAGVLGRRFEPAALVSVTEKTEEEVIDGLDAGCQARLLIDIGGGYQFAHDLVREVVEADLCSPPRGALHRRAAMAIEALHAVHLGDHYEALADHWQRGEVWDKALEFFVLSGDKAVRAGAIREAMKHYEAALGICARLGASASGVAV